MGGDKVIGEGRLGWKMRGERTRALELELRADYLSID